MSDDPKLHGLVGGLTDLKATLFDATPASMIALLKAVAAAVSGSLVVSQVGPATGTQSNVASSATSVTILAAAAGRKGATIWNDSTATLYLLVGTGTASATVATVAIQPGGYYELPFWSGGVYTGILVGIWSAANGSARITQYT